MLVYRGEETARLREFLEADPRAGRPGPRLAVISGAAGMGKTELLHEIADFAAANRVTVVSAVAAPTEQDLPYAVLEQLQQDVPAEPEHRTDPPGRPEAAATSAPVSQVPLRVLSELTRGLGAPATAGRVLITVDDIQFADAQSRQVLEYLLRNSGFSGLSVVVTEGPAATGEAFCADASPEAGRVLRMRLGPLGVEDVARLLADQLPAAEATHLAPDFHRATGGNPMLLKALAADQLLPSAARRGGGTPQAGDLFRQAALRCAQRSGDYALAVARGLALLREPPTSPNVSLLLSVEDQTIRSAAAALEDAGILYGRQFRHEAMGEAVLDDLSTEEAARLHYCAAKLLHQGGADPVRVATQLLAQDLRGPVDEAWVWEVLQAAARQAPAGGEPDFAMRCLQMAERCCGDEATRLSIRAQLAELNWGYQPATAAQQVRSLALPARDGRLPISYTLRLVPKLMWYGYVDEATAALRLASTTAAETHAPRLEDEVKATRLQVAGTYPDALTENDRAPYAERRPEPEAAIAVTGSAATEAAATAPVLTKPTLTKPTLTKSTASHPAPTALRPTAPAPPASTPPASAPTKPAPGAAARARVRVFGALNSVLGLRSGSTAVADAEQILRSTMLTETTAEMLLAALGALILSDLLASSARWCDRLLGQARGKRAVAMLMAVRAHIYLRQGNLTAAVERAEASLARLPAHGWGVGIGLPLSALVEARTRMGHHEAAAELLERPVPDAMFRTRYGLSYLHARAALQLQTGRHHAALADFLRCGELMMAWGMDSPALVPWRTGAAQTWLRLQDSERAAALVEDELSRTHPEHLRTRGAALRVLAAARPLPQRPALLEEAVRLLRDAGDSYTLALAMTDLGHAYKRLGAPAKGRGLVRQAGQMADICGAYEPFRAPQPAAARVAPARVASARVAPAGPDPLSEGAEPASGAGIRAEEALTEAERRVARLAALGHTNREISSKLFITVSTVEQHLTRVYRKINIRRRQDLPTTLDFDVADCA
ncbi:helix-turn-helix transcriptional regulator [Streptomyces sp. NRRL S-920]|uniref:helix-turn-helix transcriptional regulator n=1 Tax=Streptomyces sp. NRRL S-920 TaxID=1463921 RepID=UPI0005621D4F|nr:helix-turn-helix transcriptional regulator [Streptomyces sp. NRRL S-920]